MLNWPLILLIICHPLFISKITALSHTNSAEIGLKKFSLMSQEVQERAAHNNTLLNKFYVGISTNYNLAFYHSLHYYANILNYDSSDFNR